MMEEGTGIYSRELFDPTDVNDFRNRRVLIDLQEKTPSISFYIAKEDAYIASLTGIIKSNRTKFLLIVPNKRVMKEILKHIFKLTGQLYEDIPIVFRQSHVTLALYLKHCLMSGSCSDTALSQTRPYIHYDGLLKERKENEVLRSIGLKESE